MKKTLIAGLLTLTVGLTTLTTVSAEGRDEFYYDFNSNNRIDKHEGEIAVQDYFSNQLEIQDLFRVLMFHFTRKPIDVTESKPVNREPVAVIDYPEQSFQDTKIHLDGSGSYDPDYDKLTYHWYMPELDATLTPEGSSAYLFVPGGKWWGGKIYPVQLTVTDEQGATDTVEVDIIVSNQP